MTTLKLNDVKFPVKYGKKIDRLTQEKVIRKLEKNKIDLLSNFIYDYQPKKQITNKKLKQLFNKNIYIANDLIACHFLNRMHPTYYNKGVYGLNYDVYTFKNFAIVTGYRNFGNWEKIDIDKLSNLLANS